MLAGRKLNAAEQRSLERLGRAKDLKSRRKCVDYARAIKDTKTNTGFVFRLCDSLIPDRSPYVRWQSFFIIESLIETDAERVWRFCQKWGVHPNRDIQTGIGVCVLETLLEYDFQTYFPRVRDEIKKGDREFARSFRFCWATGKIAESVRMSAMLDELTKEARSLVRSRRR